MTASTRQAPPVSATSSLTSAAFRSNPSDLIMSYRESSAQRALEGALLQRMGLTSAHVTSLVIRFEAGVPATASVELTPAASDMGGLLSFDYSLTARPDGLSPHGMGNVLIAERFRILASRQDQTAERQRAAANAWFAAKAQELAQAKAELDAVTQP
jgi:hypothetical protein